MRNYPLPLHDTHDPEIVTLRLKELPFVSIGLLGPQAVILHPWQRLYLIDRRGTEIPILCLYIDARVVLVIETPIQTYRLSLLIHRRRLERLVFHLHTLDQATSISN